MNNNWLYVLRTHMGYAAACLSGVLILFEFLMPGSVLPYIPLFPLCILSFFLLILMPERESGKVQIVISVLLLALISALLLLKMGGLGGKSLVLLLLAVFFTAIIGGQIIAEKT